MSALIQTCTKCSASYFPARLVCCHCHGTDFANDKADTGVVETTTRLSNGFQIATVTFPGDVYFIARIIGGTADAGDRIRLTNDPSDDTEVAAFVPLHGTEL
jgi:uncharacterized OB-fold protein